MIPLRSIYRTWLTVRRDQVTDLPLSTVTQVAQLIRDGELSATEVVSVALDRIDQTDETLRAWETVDRDGALAQAKAADEAITRGETLGPLHGVPVGIKDIIATAGIRTSMGSSIYSGTRTRSSWKATISGPG